jgi:hypothetical protein
MRVTLVVHYVIRLVSSPCVMGSGVEVYACMRTVKKDRKETVTCAKRILLPPRSAHSP